MNTKGRLGHTTHSRGCDGFSGCLKEQRKGNNSDQISLPDICSDWVRWGQWQSLLVFSFANLDWHEETLGGTSSLDVVILRSPQFWVLSVSFPSRYSIAFPFAPFGILGDWPGSIESVPSVSFLLQGTLVVQPECTGSYWQPTVTFGSLEFVAGCPEMWVAPHLKLMCYLRRLPALRDSCSLYFFWLSLGVTLYHGCSFFNLFSDNFLSIVKL